MIDRFGDAIEYDLAVRNIDLTDEWRLRRFRRILNLVDHLPRNSAYVQAVTNDDEWAEQMLHLPESDRRPSVQLSDWSPEMERLTDLYDRIGELIRAVVASAGAKARRVPLAPRPTTALDRARARRRRTQHNRLVSLMLPHRTHDE